MELLLVTAITVVVSVILLTFIKPSEKEIEKEIQAYKVLDKAKKDLFYSFVQSFKINKFVEWLSGKLSQR